MGDQPAGRNVGRRGRAWLALRGQRLLFMGWRGVQSEPQSGACCSKKHHHVPFWLYATPAHAIRDVLHASNYLTITEGPGRFGSILGQHVTTHVDVHTSLLLACNRPSCNRNLVSFRALQDVACTTSWFGASVAASAKRTRLSPLSQLYVSGFDLVQPSASWSCLSLSSCWASLHSPRDIR